MITKRLLHISLSLLVLLSFSACQDEDQEFGNVVAPTNLSVSFTLEGQSAENPNGDGSGLVTFTATADNALAFKYSFGDNTSEEVTASGTITHRFSVQGLNTYTVSVVATGTGGAPTTTTFEIDVFSAFDDVEARAFLTGATLSDDGNGNLSLELTEPSSKTWYLDTASSGHLGVGPTLAFDLEINGGVASGYWFPAFFAAAPGQFCGDENSSCFCDDELTFTIDTDNNISFELNNNGQTFFNVNHQDIVGGDGSGDACFDFDTSGVSDVTLAPTSEDWSQVGDPDFSPRGTVLNFTNDAFMSYYVSSSSYEILSITEDAIHLRTLDGLDSNLAWYVKFSTTQPD